MKKTLKRILQIVGLFVILIVAFGIFYMIKANSEIKKMSTVETKKITDNIYAVKDSYCNMYLIEDSGKYIAIDAGNKIKVIAEELKKLSINPNDVIALLLTHTDGDHTGAIKLFKNARVYLSTEEEKLLTGDASRFLFFGNSIDTDDYTLLENKKEIIIGNIAIKGILTPGHTIGSMCYLVNDHYLFTGDALGLENGKITGFNKFFNSDTKTALKSIGNLTNLSDVSYIFSAHHGYSNDYNFAVNSWESK